MESEHCSPGQIRQKCPGISSFKEAGFSATIKAREMSAVRLQHLEGTNLFNAAPGLLPGMKIEIRDTRIIDAAVYVMWILLWVYCVFGFWGHTYDDVYLAYVYAKHILAGDGFVFNVGENVLGTPAPLFVLLLVVIKKIIPVCTIPQAGSLISGTGLALAGFAAYRFGARYSERATGLLAGLLIIFNPFSVLVLGGETPLYLALVLWAFYLFTGGRETAAAVLLGLALMNRTEAVVPIGVVLCAALLEKRRIPWKMVFVTVAVLVPWLVYSFTIFGTPVTGSFTAKVSQVSAGLPRYPVGLWRWSRDIVFSNNPLLGAGIPLAVFGFLTLFHARRGWQIIVIWAVLQTLFYALLPIPFYHWYAAQIGVLGAVLSAVGAIEIPALFRGTARSLRMLAEKLDTRKTGTFYLARRWTGAFIGMSALTGTLMAVLLYGGVKSVLGYQEFIPRHPSNLIYQKTGKWFAENSPPGSRIAYLEIGQIAFYADRYIIDTLGLVTPGVHRQVAELNWPWAVEKYKADYIIYNASFRDWIDPVMRRPWFRDGFEEVARISEPGYPSPLIIYRRRDGLSYPPPTTPDTVQLRHDGSIGEIFGDKVVRQVFVAGKDNLSGAELLFGTFNRQNSGTVHIALLNEKKATIAEVRVPVADIPDNAYHRFDFPPVPDSGGKLFILHVDSADSISGKAITLWKTSKRNILPKGNLYYSGRRMEGALSFKTYALSE